MGTFSGPGLSLINTCAAATEGKSQSFFCRLRSGANYPDWPGLAVQRWLHANAEMLNSCYGNAWERCNRIRTVMGYRAQGTVWSNCCSLNGIAVWCFFFFPLADWLKSDSLTKRWSRVLPFPFPLLSLYQTRFYKEAQGKEKQICGCVARVEWKSIHLEE